MLPEPVRGEVVALAAAALGALKPEDTPAALARVQRFTPAKRARLGGNDLLQALDTDPTFRLAVLTHARTAQAGETALAYLGRTEGWEDLVTVAAATHEQTSSAVRDHATELAVRRLTEQLDALRATSRAELERARFEAEEMKAELTAVRRKVRDLGSRLGRAEQAQEAAEAALQHLRAERAAAGEAGEADLRRMRDDLAQAERALSEARRATREGAKGDVLRQRLLLDAIVDAAQGLRRELALPVVEGRPADALAGDYAAPSTGASSQGRSADDPALLDALLGIPMTHLMVDGYNVTKTGYGGLTLEAQRTRLLSGLGALAARTGAETTVVFDGAQGTLAVAAAAPRGVRLLFSRRGETADEVLRRLAHHEPAGRPVVVVSSDREVADGVRDAGATAVPSVALLRLLERSVGGGS